MMLSRKPLAFWLLAVLTSSCTSGASSTTVPLAPDFSAADEVLQGYVEEGRLAGVILMVAHRGEIAHFETYGSMDLEAQKPMRKDTIFRIYSMTKSITTAAALMLYEDGRLELEAPVSQYIPELTRLKVYTDAGTHEAEREMTVRDLMLHTSGFTYGIFGQTAVDALYQEAKPLAARDLQQMVENLAGLPLMFNPGSGWNYGVSTDVLGRIVELQSGSSLGSFLHERIFEPLGMHETGFSVPGEKLDRFAATYSSEGDQLTLLDAPATSRFASEPTFFSGGGGLVSTASDYMRFGLMIANGGELDGVRLLERETVALMTTSQIPDELVPIAVTDPIEGTGFGFGFAVRVATSDDSAGAVGDYGWSGIASTHFWVSPKHDLVTILLEQTMPFSPLTQDGVKGSLYAAVEAAVSETVK